jgi:uncharacterized OB-fold protein
MEHYEKKVGSGEKGTITGSKCSVCGFVLLDNDDDIWSALGL